ncbi:MAG: Rrf2 family transcriptional regulator [Eubacterium sp.]|nr:Rrf2 family transcriptional regulator [Eubacterium sp.]MDD7209909.1 Rrf2 family transcriptional regulator [Lachnospiraceae bacterium]MDY5498239.1 Rrf2 family transcriptional regulator [Anaerobutyricum sp.]
MMISSKGRYALRVMIDLAQNNNGELIPLKEIANRQNISMKYLEMIVSLLHKGGLLVSGRGKKGGYRLAKDPSECSIGAILKLTERTLSPVNCIEGGMVNCEKAGGCITLPMWQKLDGMIDEYLENVSLEDLLKGKV